METGLNAGPPRLLERAVAPLIPPVVREEIVGDLWERFRSPTQYFADAMLALPYLIASQTRRATEGRLFALQAFTIFASFGGFEPTLGPATVTMWQRALLATLPALAALLLRNAYRRSDEWTARRAAGDLAAMLLAVLAVESLVAVLGARGIVDPYWRIWDGFLIGGLLFSLLIVFVLRSAADLAPRSSQPVTEASAAIGLEYQLFCRNLGLKHAADIATLGLLLVFVLLFSLNAKIPLVAQVGFAWVALALPVVLYRLLRQRTQPMPASLGFAAQVAFYRDGLARQRADIGLAAWLCFGPLFAGLGLNMIVRGVMRGWFGLAFGGVCCVAALAFMIVQASRARRQRLDEKIAALDRLDRLRSD